MVKFRLTEAAATDEVTEQELLVRDVIKSFQSIYPRKSIPLGNIRKGVGRDTSYKSTIFNTMSDGEIANIVHKFGIKYKWSRNKLIIIKESYMKIKKLNESVEHPYMFQYSCNNSTFGYDFQRYAQELGANRMYDHTQKGGGLHFYTVPSEDVYNKLKEVAKKRFMVDMYSLRPFDRERYANARIQESMTIAYDKDTIKNMIERVRRNLEDYKSLLTEFPEDREYWKEMIRKCELEIAELESYDMEV